MVELAKTLMEINEFDYIILCDSAQYKKTKCYILMKKIQDIFLGSTWQMPHLKNVAIIVSQKICRLSNLVFMF